MSSLPMPGLADRVHDAQHAYRAVLQALARPGTVQHVGSAIEGVPLGGAMARLLLALCDEDTAVWWQADGGTLQQWLRFHTGAPLASDRGAATFAVIHEPLVAPTLNSFAMGSAREPEFSATLCFEVASLQEGPLVHAYGPGIRERIALHVAGLSDDFWSQWQANHAGFPQGVDVLLTCGPHVLGLPRTTRVRRLQEV